MQYIVKFRNETARIGEKGTTLVPAGEFKCNDLSHANMVAEGMNGGQYNPDANTTVETRAQVFVKIPLPFDCGGTLTVQPEVLRSLLNDIGHAVDEYESNKRAAKIHKL
jgi:hypothetical protein